MKKSIALSVATSLLFVACNSKPAQEKDATAAKASVDSFLVDYNKQFQKYLIASNEGQWKLNTHIVAGDTATENAAARADEAMATFTGGKAITEKAKSFLDKKDSLHLSDLQVRQLKAILFNAGANPE